MKTIEEKVEWISFLHKQNLNGRETEDELFEAGILAGIEETEVDRDEFAIEFSEWLNGLDINDYVLQKHISSQELLEIYKKEKGL